MKSIPYTLALSLLFGVVLTGCPDDDDSEAPIEVPVDMAADEGSAQDAPADLAAAPDQGNAPDQSVTPDDMGEQAPDMGADLGGEADMPVDQGAEEDMSVVDMSMIYPAVTEEPLGGARPATIVVPEGFDNTEEVPLVILLHGYTATGALQDSYFKLSAQVDSKDFILVYPDGTRDAQGNQFWNATDACCDAFRTGVDDVGYLRGMIEEALTRFNVDRGRIYLLGHSNGGFMSYRMACEVSEYVTGIFSLAGASYKEVADCQPDNPVHVVQMHGTIDPTISYNGGSAYPGAPAYPSAADTVGAWAGYNDCTSELIDLPVGDVGDASVLPMGVKGYEGCDVNGSVELWTIQGGNHLPTLPATFAETVLDHLFAFDRTP